MSAHYTKEQSQKGLTGKKQSTNQRDRQDEIICEYKNTKK
jgi:hypothetical protein